jgi:hypothetical protein
VLVLQPTVFADPESFAILPELLHAGFLALARFQAPGHGLVHRGQRPMAAGVFLHFLVTMRLGKQQPGEKDSRQPCAKVRETSVR